jgi:hypothetical protein
LWYGEPDAVSNAIGYAKFRCRSHDAVIRIYDEAGKVIETHAYIRLIISNFRRELSQIVNAELPLDVSDFVHHALKALLAEKFVFLFLEILA